MKKNPPFTIFSEEQICIFKICLSSTLTRHHDLFKLHQQDRVILQLKIKFSSGGGIALPLYKVILFDFNKNTLMSPFFYIIIYKPLYCCLTSNLNIKGTVNVISSGSLDSHVRFKIVPFKLLSDLSRSSSDTRYKCKESYFRGVRIFCTAVYCLWAEK